LAEAFVKISDWAFDVAGEINDLSNIIESDV
jgi:hypothetical protein